MGISTVNADLSNLDDTPFRYKIAGFTVETTCCVNKKASCATKTKVTKFCKKGKGLRDCFALCSPQCQRGAFPTNVLS